jgi:hypothetical protein
MGRFIAYEISPVAEDDFGTCEPHASMEEARTNSDSTFWSLYGVTPDREVMCIGDFCDYARVAEIYTRITGRIVPENPDALRMLDLPAGR